MTRVRRRQSRQMTEDAEWAHRREYMMRNHQGDDLLETAECWEREPGVPDELRDSKRRWLRIVPVDNPSARKYAGEMDKRWTDILEGRRAWLAENGYR